MKVRYENKNLSKYEAKDVVSSGNNVYDVKTTRRRCNDKLNKFNNKNIPQQKRKILAVADILRVEKAIIEIP